MATIVYRGALSERRKSGGPRLGWTGSVRTHHHGSSRHYVLQSSARASRLKREAQGGIAAWPRNQRKLEDVEGA